MLHEKSLAEDFNVFERSLNCPAKWLCLECVVELARLALESFHEVSPLFRVLGDAHTNEAVSARLTQISFFNHNRFATVWLWLARVIIGTG